MTPRRRLIILATLVLTGTGIGSVVAQTSVDDLDLEAIQSRAQKEAAVISALVSSAIAQQANAKDTFAEAQTTVELAKERLGDAATRINSGPNTPGSIDIDTMVANAGKVTAPTSRSAPQFLAFASLAMPEDSLRELIRDVSRAGGTVVFRGFSQQGAGVFMKGLSKVIPPGAQARISIDPRLFKAFHVDSVPTYIALADGVVPCANDACTADPQVFDRLSGNVTTAFASETIADGHGPGAQVARAVFAALRGAP